MGYRSDWVSDPPSTIVEAPPDTDDLHRMLFDVTPVPTAVIDRDARVRDAAGYVGRTLVVHAGDA